MKRLLFPAALAATLTSLISPLTAQDATADEITSYVLADGSSIRGTVLAFDSKTHTVKMRLKVAAGEMTVSGNLDDFSPLSGYRILRDHLDPDGLEEHIQLAEFAVEHDLIRQARQNLLKAKELAAGKELPGYLEAQLAERAYSTVELVIEKLLDDGDDKEARKVVANVRAAKIARIPESRIDALAGLIDSRLAHEAAMAEAKRDIKAEQQATAYRERALRPLNEMLERAEERRRSALLGSKSFSSAHRDLNRAVADMDRLFKRSAKLRKSNANDEVLASRLDAAEAKAKTLRDDCLLAAGSLDLTRGNFNRAMAAVNKVLADDPEHERALAMRARIEQAANQPWGNGWIGGQRIR